MNLLKKRNAPSPESSGAHNPYLAARREWDERYGDLITRAKNWRTMAALCSLGALVATAGIVWLSARSRVVPFVVLVDNLGRPVASGAKSPTASPSPACATSPPPRSSSSTTNSQSVEETPIHPRPCHNGRP